MGRRAPGYAFSLPTSAGHAVGILTHHNEFYGDLVWISEDLFDHPPTPTEAATVSAWRWPTYFWLGSAVYENEVTKIGRIPVPEALRTYPVMRGGSRQQGWWIVRDGSREFDVATAEPTEDWSIPPEHLVDSHWLRDAVETDWRPEQYR